MTDGKKPEDVSDAALDAVSGGPTEELFGAYNFAVAADGKATTQNDLDNGRLIAEVGIAPLKPAEFVTFRIGQKTADSGK